MFHSPPFALQHDASILSVTGPHRPPEDEGTRNRTGRKLTMPSYVEMNRLVGSSSILQPKCHLVLPRTYLKFLANLFLCPNISDEKV